MAQAIVMRTMKKMMNNSSSKLLFEKTFISNSGSTFGRIPHNQQLSTTRKAITSFSPLTNNHHHFLHPSATTSRRNYFFLFRREDHKHPVYSYHDEQKLPKFSPWLAVPVGIMLLVLLDTLDIPYCRPDPVIDREDHVRYCFKVEPLVRQEHVQFKIVDNSVLELSYKNRYYPSRIVKKELPKGNYANAELRGWLNKTKTSNVFMVDITGFKRDPPTNMNCFFELENLVRQEDVELKIVDDSVLELSYMNRSGTDRTIVRKELPKINYANAEIRGWLDERNLFQVNIVQRESPTKEQQQLSDTSTN